MALLHHRKLLFAEPQKTPEFDKGFSSSCYMCYVCPKNCYISPPPPQLSYLDDIPEKDHVSTVVIMMLCILGVAFLVLSYLTIARYRCRRRNSESLEASRAEFLDQNHGPVLDHPIWYIRTVGLPQSVIDSIALFPYKAGDGLIDGHDCSVCLNDFQENESLRLLPKCSHAFHVGCIDTWLRSHMTCPVCRAPILVGNTNTARVSPVESSPSSSESNQGENGSEDRGGSETGESRGATMPVQEAGISSKNRLRVLSDLADHSHRVEVDDRELQTVRRSVSMDFSTVAMIYPKGEEGCSNTKLEIIGKQNSDQRDCSICTVMKSSSYVESRPVSMKRSFSRSLRKNSRSLESIQIPEISLEN